MSETDAEVSDPWFTQIKDTLHGVKSEKWLMNPLFDSRKTIIAGLQLEYKTKRGFSEREVRNSNIDKIIFDIFTSIVQLKMDTLIAQIDVNEKNSHLFDTLSLVSQITTQRSYKSLIKQIKMQLPAYFGSQAVGVLLFDTKTQDLFTISELTNKRDAKDEFEEYSDSGDIISFPSTLGITGLVFQKGNVYVSNSAKTDRKFTPDIDNLTDITEVEDFIIFPIFTAKGKKPVGVIQLINNHDADISRIEIIQELLGRSVTNTCKIHELINVTIGFKSRLGSIENLASNTVFECELGTKINRHKNNL